MTMTYSQDYPEIAKRLFELADAVGMQIDYTEKPDSPYTWDGRRFFIHISDSRDILTHPSQRSISDFAHEIAHFLEAPRQRRAKPEFGLGRSPGNASEVYHRTPIHVRVEDIHFYEMQASCLGILIEHHMGHNPRHTIHHHCWTDSDGSALYVRSSVLDKLWNRSLIDDEGPTCFYKARHLVMIEDMFDFCKIP